MKVYKVAPNGVWREVKLSQAEQRAHEIWGVTAAQDAGQDPDPALSLDLQRRWEYAWRAWHGGDDTDELSYDARRLNTSPAAVMTMGLVNGLGLARNIAEKGAWIGRCLDCHQVTIWTGTLDRRRRGSIPHYCKECGPQVRRRQARDSARRQRGTDLSERLCPACSSPFIPKRSDARCCSAKCRAKLSRSNPTPPSPAPNR